MTLDITIDEESRRGMIPGGRGGLIHPPFQAGSERTREIARKGGEAKAARRRNRQLMAEVQTLRGWRLGAMSIDGSVKTVGDAVRHTASQIAVQAYEGDSRAFTALLKASGLTETSKDRQTGDIVNNGTMVIVGDDVADRWLSKYK